MKYLAGLRKHFSQEKVFSMRDMQIFLAKSGASRQYIKHLVHNLLKKKEIHRICKGIYSFRNEIDVAGFAFSPFYYGLQNALSIRNLWEQETNPVIITPRKVRAGVREIMGSNAVVKHIGRKMFFGFELMRKGDYWLPVSTPEKTLIDFAYFNEPLNEETIKELKKKIDKNKLNEFLELATKKTVKKVRKILD